MMSLVHSFKSFSKYLFHNRFFIYTLNLVFTAIFLFSVYKHLDKIVMHNELLLVKANNAFYKLYDKSNISCNKYSNDIKACTEANRNGRSCFWYSACSACLNGGIDGNEYCKAITTQSPIVSANPVKISLEKNKKVAGVETKINESVTPTVIPQKMIFECSRFNKDFFGCLEPQSRGAGCVWQSCKGGLCVLDDGVAKDHCK